MSGESSRPATNLRGVCMNEKCPQYLWEVLSEPGHQRCERCGQPLYPSTEARESPR
jgi:hypothetical protein